MENNGTSLGQIIRVLLMQSKFILAIVFLGSSLGITSYLTTDNTYKLKSLVQVFSVNSLDSNTTLDLGTSDSPDLGTLVDVYKSRSNLTELVIKEKLYIGLQSDPKKIEYINSFRPEFFNEKSKGYKIVFYQDGFKLESNSESSPKFQYDTSHFYDSLEINIAKPSDLEEGDVLELTLLPLDSAIKIVNSRLNIENIASRASFYNIARTGLLNTSYLSNDIERGKEILNTANEIFISQSIEVETEQAKRAINFINSSLSSIETDLVRRKDQLTNFRETNKNALNVDLEISNIINALNTIEAEILTTDREIVSAQSSFTSSNPILKQLESKKNTLLQQKTEIEDKITNLPNAQQQYIDLVRNVEITQSAYTELINKRLEFSIKEASTIGNIRIIDKAYNTGKVNPKLSIIYLAFLFSLVVAVGVAIFRGLFLLPISNPAELADASIFDDITGVVPFDKDEESKERLDQSLESLFVNIQTISVQKNLEQNVTVLITSPTPENGKSYISREIAKKIATIGKKVLLIDSDYKRGDQNKEFNSPKINSREFLDIKPEDLHRFNVSENLYFIPKLSRITSSFHLVLSDEYAKKINMLKQEFDYIIIDTSPLLSVSDTGVLMSFSDINLGVVRHAKTKINEIRQLKQICEQTGHNFDGFVYNAYQKPSSYYGYYGIYGNYSYQYYAQKYLYESYDYKKTD